jgi:hypothetical protein
MTAPDVSLRQFRGDLQQARLNCGQLSRKKAASSLAGALRTGVFQKRRELRTRRASARVLLQTQQARMPALNNTD